MSIATYGRNQLLSSLPAEDVALLMPHLRDKVLSAGSTVFEPGVIMRIAYFPRTGAISLRVGLRQGKAIETALVGRNAILGGLTALDPRPASCTAVVLMEAATLAIHMDALRELATTRPAIHSMLLGCESRLLAETQQNVACAALHPLEARLSRWLLWARDITGTGTIGATQHSIAEVLGVRRTSVCLAAHTMQQAGVIRTRRGRIEIRNDAALQETACECYRRISQDRGPLTTRSTRHTVRSPDQIQQWG